MVAPEILALAGFLSVLLVALGAFVVRKPTVVQERLGKIGGMANLEQLELQRPFADRVVRPIVDGLSRLIASRTPQATIDQLQRQILVAGSPGDLDVRDVLGLKGIGAIVLGGVFFLVFGKSFPMLQSLGMGAALTILGFYGPNLWLKSRADSRKKSIQKALPDALDLLCICIEAGLGFDQALNRVATKWQNELSGEFQRALAEIRMGKSRRDALRDMVDRTDVPDLAAFVAAIIQADQLGVSIGNVMITQAEQMRVRRRQRAEESAHKAPVKMVFPLVLLIFPALFVVILGPALPKISDALLK